MPSVCNKADSNGIVLLNTQILSKLTHIPDAQVIYPLLVNVDSYVLATSPSDTVYIAPSSIPNAGLGVFAARSIPRLSYFGPYCCNKYNDSVHRNRNLYTWEVVDGSSNKMYYIDGSELNKSNWLRYVNCPNTLKEQNLVPFVNDGEIFYLTVRNILEGEELLVYYGDNYARKLGIDPTKFYSRSS